VAPLFLPQSSIRCPFVAARYADAPRRPEDLPASRHKAAPTAVCREIRTAQVGHRGA